MIGTMNVAVPVQPSHVVTHGATPVVEPMVMHKPSGSIPASGHMSGGCATVAIIAGVAAVTKARRRLQTARRAEQTIQRQQSVQYDSYRSSSSTRVWTEQGIRQYASMLGKSGAEVGASVTEEQMQKLASLGVALDLGASRDMLNNKTATAPVHVSSAFDSGNGDLWGAPKEVSYGVWFVTVGLRPEPFTHRTDNRAHLQWFNFRVSNASGRTLRVSIPNAGDASYPDAWSNYRPATSYDGVNWFRCAYATYDGVELRWEHRMPPEVDTVWFSYFAPYDYEQHQGLIAECSTSPLSRCAAVGTSLGGRPIDIISVGCGPRQVWIIARQHPGETMAEWASEGLLKRMIDPDDALARQLRQDATFHIVPNINPDGSVMGHLRTNACGANLNREWAPSPDGTYMAPTLERSPEVYYVLQQMDKTGCDCFIDVRGDEAIESTFLVTNARTARIAELENQLGQSLLRANPDFQLELGYAQATPEADRDMSYQQDLLKRRNVGSIQVGARFDCLSVTLEMPFKDSRYNTPEPACQWSPARSQNMGKSLVDAIAHVLPDLRE